MDHALARDTTRRLVAMSLEDGELADLLAALPDAFYDLTAAQEIPIWERLLGMTYKGQTSVETLAAEAARMMEGNGGSYEQE